MLLIIMLIVLLSVGFYIVKPVAWGRIDGAYGYRMYQNFRGVRLSIYEWAYRLFGGK